MININNVLNELGFEINENKINHFLEKAGFRNNIMKSESIKGAFSKLSEQDKQSVIDTLNESQELFDNLFGTHSKRWTVEDLTNAFVDVDIETPSDNKKDCKCDNCTSEKKAQKEKSSVADILRREAAAKKEAAKKVKTKELMDAVVAKAVEKFSDTRAHNYTIESDSNGNPIAYTNVLLLTPEGAEIASDGEFRNSVSKAITEHTGARKTTVDFVETSQNGNYLRIGLVL